MRASKSLSTLVAAFAFLPSLACQPTDPKNPETWIARLSESDGKKRVQAVQELRKLKAKQAAAPVAELLKDAAVREDAALALGDLGGPEQVQPLIDAIDTPVGAASDQAVRLANRTNGKIADSLGAIAPQGSEKACAALGRLTLAQDDLVRLSATQAVGRVRCKGAAAELSRMVDNESTPPLLIKKAIVALGLIGEPAAIPALEHALVLERMGVSFLPEASLALFQLGEPAVLPMIALLEDKDEAFAKWAREKNRAAAGTYAKAALVLGDLGDPRAVPALLAKLKYTDPDPLPATSRLLSSSVRQYCAEALGRLHVKDAAAPIFALVSTKDNGDEDLSTFAANALVSIGDRAQAKGLVKAGASGAIRARIPVLQAAALLGEAELAGELEKVAAAERKGRPAECARSVQEMTQAPAPEEKGACDRLADALAQLALPLKAAAECKDAKACWTGKLTAPDALVRARAAWELGRMGAAEAVPALLKACADPEAPARLAAASAVEALLPLPAAKGALQAGAATLAAQLDAEQGRVQFVKVNEELRRLQWKLAHVK
jgi:HEAT repeat protein